MTRLFLFPLNQWFGLPQAMVETVNNLLQPQAQAVWRELSSSEQLRAATMLLDTVEQGAFVLADNLLKTDIVQENTENIREYMLRFLVLGLHIQINMNWSEHESATKRSWDKNICLESQTFTNWANWLLFSDLLYRRSLGHNREPTDFLLILPQAFKCLLHLLRFD